MFFYKFSHIQFISKNWRKISQVRNNWEVKGGKGVARIRQISKMELSAKAVNDLTSLNLFAKKLHLKSLTRSSYDPLGLQLI